MEYSKTDRLRARFAGIASLLLFIAVVTVNALANILPINGVGTGQLSDEIPNLFVPAGLTFSVWGLIYVLLACYAVAAVGQAFRKKASALWNAADGAIFSLNMAANAAWIFAWHYRQVALSLGLMLVILGTLIWLEERNAAKARTGSADAGGRATRFFLRTSLNVYLGWICVATIANVTALLVVSGWGGWGMDPRFWTVAMIVAGLAVGSLLIFLRGAVAAPLVIVWAYAGIVIKRLQTDRDYSSAIWISAIVAASLLLVEAGAGILLRLKARRA